MDLNQFYCKCGTCRPRAPNASLMHIVYNIESHFDSPVIVSSGHRCAPWNAKFGGAPNSFHIHRMAIDFCIEGFEKQTIYDWIDTNIELCGLGIYNSHVHVDGRRYKARWDKR